MTEPGNVLLDRAQLERAFTALGERLLRRGVVADVFIVGGAAMGLPPMAYLAQVRAEHAAVLLLYSDEPITGIGRAVGWPDQNYFARRFKAHYGLSATTYRKRFATGAAHLHDPEVPDGPADEVAPDARTPSPEI